MNQHAEKAIDTAVALNAEGQGKVDSFLRHIDHPHREAIQKIQNVVLRELQLFAYSRGFSQLMPLLMSPITDPLNHQVYPAEISYEGRPLRLTASMIFHKQLALVPKTMNKIFIMAPNIRLELATKKSSENHLLEFSQFDLEIKHGTIDDVMSFLEDLYMHLFPIVEKECAAELRALGRTLPKLSKPFPRYSNIGLRPEEVDPFADRISRESSVPCFITSYKREFYDLEDPKQLGTYRNLDMVYPEAYGEALSGAERTYQYEDILRRMGELKMDLAPYANYLEVARRGILPKTAGCGIGIQRLIKYICGKSAIADVCLFDRCVKTDFTF